MKIALFAASLSVIMLAIAASYVLPSVTSADQPQPYKFASAR